MRQNVLKAAKTAPYRRLVCRSFIAPTDGQPEWARVIRITPVRGVDGKGDT
jgi:hypothetical protein